MPRVSSASVRTPARRPVSTSIDSVENYESVGAPPAQVFTTDYDGKPLSSEQIAFKSLPIIPSLGLRGVW